MRESNRKLNDHLEQFISLEVFLLFENAIRLISKQAFLSKKLNGSIYDKTFF